MKRRQVLSSVAVGVVGSAGCLRFGEIFPDEGRAQIGAVGVVNLTDQAYSVSVQIERNGDRIHDRSYESDEISRSTVLERTWPCEPATFVVRAEATNDEEPFEVSFTEERVFDPDVVIERGGRAMVTKNTVGRNDCMS